MSRFRTETATLVGTETVYPSPVVTPGSCDPKVTEAKSGVSQDTDVFLRFENLVFDRFSRLS